MNRRPDNQPAVLPFFLNKIEALEKRNMTLEGRIEELEFQLKRNEDEFRDRYLDLDARISRMSGAGATQPTAQGAATPWSSMPPLKGDNQPVYMTDSPSPEAGREEREQADYQKAFGLIRDREFDQALIALRQLLRDYPRGNLSGNAQFWLGEVLMAQGKYEPARVEFEVCVGTISPECQSAGCSL